MSLQEGRWAGPVERLEVSGLADGEALDLNVTGRRLSGAVQGFGPLWQKTYWTRLTGADVSPVEVIDVWKRDYPDFWPDNSSLHRAVARLEPGDVAVINASQSGLRLSTGVFVMYVDDESFAFALPEGHMFSGWITFSAHRDGQTTVAQVQPFFRASDPIFDLMFVTWFDRKEDQIWHHTLRSLAAVFGVDGIVQQSATCLDDRRQWRHVGNVRHNAGIRSAVHQMTGPVRRVLARRHRGAVSAGGEAASTVGRPAAPS
jgi:hypothetical protein